VQTPHALGLFFRLGAARLDERLDERLARSLMEVTRLAVAPRATARRALTLS
jgi:hypothetical protein